MRHKKDITLAYTRMHFNKLRKVLGFKQDSELSELVEKSEAFRIVRNRQTLQMEAFMSPLVGDRFVPTPNQEIVEPAIPYGVFFCKANKNIQMVKLIEDVLEELGLKNLSFDTYEKRYNWDD